VVARWVLAVVLLVPGLAAAEPFYQWQFSEWREVEHFGGLAAKLVPEPLHEQYGDYVLEEWDFLAPTIFGTPAYMSAVGHSNGRVFWAKAIAPRQGGVAGNTIGGEASIVVEKEYVRVEDGPFLRFVYSAADLEVMDFGSGRPPWFSPSAKIEMDVNVLDFEQNQTWSLTQSATARADLGIDPEDVLDDIWVLDLHGEIRRDDGLTITGPRWQWDCDTCGEGAYGFHHPRLVAPYADAIDVSTVPMFTGFTVQFRLEVSALDRGQGETAARAFAKDPVSEDDLDSDGVSFELGGLVEIEVPRCFEPGLEGVACLLDEGMPPGRCVAGELPQAVLRPAARARDLVDDAIAETRDKQHRSLVKRIVNNLRTADRALARREKAKRGAKPSPLCGADAHGVLQHAMARAGSVVCPPSAGLVQFAAATYEASEAGSSVTVELTRTGGDDGEVRAAITIAGSATPGLDYQRPVPLVLLDDGESGTRSITLPVLDDHEGEPDETVVLTVATLHGCATGAQASTEITVVDDDWVPEPPSYTVGGTVTGLEGSGLILREVVTFSEATPGNGAFTFGYPYESGSTYDVRIATQPTDPVQVCTVANATGTVGTADVTDVAVTCTTPPPPGGLDPGFGGGPGLVTATFAGSARALALQDDGRILVLSSDAVARYEADGTLDTTFGSGGVVAVAFGSGLDVEAQDVVVQPDGRIVVGGHVGARFGSPSDFALARYEADGSPDTTFGVAGAVVTDFAGFTDRAHQVLLQADGKIVLGGHATISGGNDYAVVRYTAAGVLDASFGAGGKATANIAGATDLALAAALQADGKVVLGGRVAASGGADPDVGLVRFDASGALDPSFGQQGVVRSDLSGGSWDEVSAVAIAGDGGILVAVQALLGGTFDFVLAKFDPSGTLDPAFATAGVATTAFGTSDDSARALGILPDGRIVLAGQAKSPTVIDVALAVYQADGTPDATFGDAGLLTVDFFGGGDSAQCLVVQNDGKVVVGGSARNGSTTQLVLARVIP
jgi:uncharacterized delta-60 repeat protein